MGLFSRKKTDEKKSGLKAVKPARNASRSEAGGVSATPENVLPANKEDKQSMKELYGKTAKDKVVKKERKYANAYRILVKPLITERASILSASNKYIFEVGRDANKIEISKAIEEIYGVSPVKVNIIRMKGKNVRFGRTLGVRKCWKKAIITLSQGENIKVYEGV